jgi:hypothetical protein
VQVINTLLSTGETDMCLERIARSFGFALAALAAVGVLFYSIEFEPLLSALAH